MRRHLPAVLITSIALLVAAEAVQVQAQAAPPGARYYDSPNYQNNATHDGLAPGKGLPGTTKRLWSLKLPGMVQPAVIAENKVFTVSFGNDTPTTVYAFEARTGKQVWAVQPFEDEHSAFVAYDGGRLFAVDSYGNRVALDARTGRELWRVPAVASFTWAPITTADGILYILGGGSPGVHITAVDGATGQDKWSVNTTYGSYAAPTVYGTGVYVDSGAENVYRFATSNGKAIWKHLNNNSGFGGATPVFHGSKLYVRDYLWDPAVLDGKTGKRVGPFETQRTPAFLGDSAFVVNNGRLAAVSTSTGRTLWQTPAEADALKAFTTAPIISGSVVFVGRRDGAVRGYNVTSGKLVWQGSAGAGFVVARDVMVDGRLAIGNGVLAANAGQRIVVFG